MDKEKEMDVAPIKHMNAAGRVRYADCPYCDILNSLGSEKTGSTVFCRNCHKTFRLGEEEESYLPGRPTK